MKHDDETILEGLRNNNDKALKALFDYYYNPLFVIAKQYLFDDFTADSVVCDLFYKIWEKRSSLRIEISLRPYLIRSVRNLSLDYLRDNYWDNRISLNDLDITSPLLFTTDEYPLGQLIEKELEAKVHEEINTLPEETQRVFVLSRLDGLKNPEIAEKLGISLNTVKYHIKKALSILREKLKDFLLILLLFLGN